MAVYIEGIMNLKDAVSLSSFFRFGVVRAGINQLHGIHYEFFKFETNQQGLWCQPDLGTQACKGEKKTLKHLIFLPFQWCNLLIKMPFEYKASQLNLDSEPFWEWRSSSAQSPPHGSPWIQWCCFEEEWNPTGENCDPPSGCVEFDHWFLMMLFVGSNLY